MPSTAAMSAPPRPLFVREFVRLACAAMLAVGFGAQAAPGTAPLVYAGFAFSGDFRNRDRLYPHSAELSTEQNGGFLDGLLRERLLKRPELMSRITLDTYDGKQDVSSVAFALVQESIETQRVDGRHWTILHLQANVLAFNRASKSVVASYPLRLRAARVHDRAPGSAEIKAMVREAYTTADPAENILDQWVQRFERVRIKEGAVKRLRVTDIDVAPEAQAVIDRAGQDGAALRNQLANMLEASLAEQAGIPLVPNSVGEAIGSKMAYRFSNGSELDLELPPADFALSFQVRDFVSKRIEKPAHFNDIFRFKGGITLKSVGPLARTVLDENIYGTHIVTLPKRADVQLAEWDQHFKTMQALLTALGKQLAKPEDAWFTEHASRAMDAKKGFVSASQVLQEIK